MEKLTDDQLFELLEGRFDMDGGKEMQDRVNADEATRERLNELKVIHAYLQNEKQLKQPNRTFTEKVMAGLYAKDSFLSLSPKNGLILMLGLIVASGLAIALLSSGAFDQWHTFFNLAQIPVRNNWIKVPTSVPFDLKLMVKIIVLLNILIGFVLLDRTILRPFFQRRAERF